MAIEMDRFVAGGDRRFHDVLSSAVPETDRRRTDHAFVSIAEQGIDQTGSRRGSYTLDLPANGNPHRNPFGAPPSPDPDWEVDAGMCICLAPQARSHVSLGHRPRESDSIIQALKARLNPVVRPTLWRNTTVGGIAKRSS